MTTTSQQAEENNGGGWVSAGMQTLRDYFGEEEEEARKAAPVAPKANSETAAPEHVTSNKNVSGSVPAGDNEEKNTPRINAAENGMITVKWCAATPEISDGIEEGKRKAMDAAAAVVSSEPASLPGTGEKKKIDDGVAAATTVNKDNKLAAPSTATNGDNSESSPPHQHQQTSRKRPRLKKNSSSSSAASSTTEDYEEETSSDEDESNSDKKKAFAYSPETAAAMAELQQPGMVTLPLSCLTGKIIETPEGLALLLAPHPTLKTAAEYVAAYGWNNSSSHTTVVDTHNRRWTRAEDEILKHAVEKMGGVPPHNWKEIARSFFPGTRHHNQCKQRWKKINPVNNRAKFSAEEDKTIIECVKEGLTWEQIGNKLNTGRTTEQLRIRYIRTLDPSLKKKVPWTEEEDSLLHKYQSELGNKWTDIAKKLPGRCDNDVKNRWYNRHRSGERKPDSKKKPAPNNPG